MFVSKSPIRKTVGILLVCVVALASKTFAQESQKPKPQQQPEEVVRVYTDLVQTDVMVFDKQGRFVNGLKREDFELRIDGKPQPIEFFERIAAGSADEETQLAAARGGHTANQKQVVGPVPLDRGRTIFFYVDDFHLAPGDLVFLRKALLRFIDQDMGQNDQAVITSASGQIGFLQQLTDNRAVLRAAVTRLNARPYFVRDGERPPMTEYQALLIDRNQILTGQAGRSYHDVTDFFVNEYLKEHPPTSREDYDAAELYVRNRARQILQPAAAITTNTLAVFENLVRSATQLPGRKLVFFVSDGFFLDSRNSDAPEKLQVITNSAARNGVVIYSLDARGLTSGLPNAGEDVVVDPSSTLNRESRGELLAAREGMETLARDTGGRTIFDTNALDTGLAKALKETSVYYLLAWRPNHVVQSSGKSRRIEATVIGRPDLTVRIRQGLLNAEPTQNSKRSTAKEQKSTDKPPEAKLREAIGGLYPTNDLPVALDLSYMNTPNKGLLLTASMQLMIDSLSFTTEDGKEKAMVDIAGSVYNDQGKVGATFKEQVTIAPAPNQTRQPGQAFVYNYHVKLAPGLYQIRVGVRDEKSGKVGTVNEWIEVPNLASHQLTLSSVLAREQPQLIASPAKTDQNLPSRSVLRVDHRFHRHSSLRFLVYIYNAARTPADSKPDVALQVQVLRDQQPVITTPLKEVSTAGIEALDQLPCGADLSLESLAPGHYLLLVTVIDRVSKTSASQEMRFDVQ
jgi:VWFA-related protein